MMVYILLRVRDAVEWVIARIDRDALVNEELRRLSMLNVESNPRHRCGVTDARHSHSMPTERGRGEDTTPPYSETTTRSFYRNAERTGSTGGEARQEGSL